MWNKTLKFLYKKPLEGNILLQFFGGWHWKKGGTFIEIKDRVHKIEIPDVVAYDLNSNIKVC